MKPSLLRRTLILTSLIAVYGLVPSLSTAGGLDGGGGGASVCRDQSGQLTSVQLLDLWEAENLGMQTLVNDEVTSVDDQVARALAKLNIIDSQLAQKAVASWAYIKTHTFPVGPKVVIHPPADAKNNFGELGCAFEGMMFYDDLRKGLLYKPEIFNAQKSKTGFAASYVHESIYKVLRDEYEAKTSALTRLITGCLFSADTANCLHLKPIALPTNTRVYQCSGDGNTFYLYQNKLSDKKVEWNLVYTKYQGLNFKYETKNVVQLSGEQVAGNFDVSLNPKITGLEALGGIKSESSAQLMIDPRSQPNYMVGDMNKSGYYGCRIVGKN